MAALQKERREHIEAMASCEEQRRRADKWIAEWEALNKERAKIEDERDESRDAVVRLFFGLARQYDWTVKDRDGWLGEFNMWRSAWLREIGGVIRKKHHEIDGFVLRTRDIYEHWQKTQGFEVVNAKLTAERDKTDFTRPPSVPFGKECNDE